MGAMNPYLKQYKKNQVETATPEQILILLYDGAINFLNRAKIALEQKDDELFVKSIMNCRNIILEFMNTLDMENGGQFAATLYSLYRYYHKILVKTEMSKTVDGIDEVLKHLTGLRETWQKAIDIAKAEREGILVDKYEPNKSLTTEDDDFEDEDYEDSEEED